MSSYVSHAKRIKVYKRDNYSCRYCGKENLQKGDISIDHVIPRYKGGDNNLENLVTACYMCNAIKKHTKILEEANMELIPLKEY
jgi:5-methylcytosine-specific restriction endonuclease McrA